jgi:adenylate cyclase
VAAYRTVVLGLGLLLVMLTHVTQANLPGLRLMEASARDALMRMMARPAEDSRVAIVDIDESSLARVGPWPWPRSTLADLAEHVLSEAGAARVVFDLVLPNAQDANPNSRDRARAQDAAGDQRLAALAQAGALVLGQALDYEARSAPVAAGRLGGALLNTDGPVAHGTAAAATGYVANHEGLSAARCVGNIGFVPDFDGQTRHLAPWTAFEGRVYPTLALAALACGRPNQALPPGLGLAVNEQGLWRVPFRHQPQAHVAVAAHDVLSGLVDRSGRAPVLAGRVVVVGSSALGFADRVATPVSSNVSGVTVHVEALSWLLDAADGRTPVPMPPWLMLAWALVCGAGLAAVLAARPSGPWHMAGAVALAGAGWLGLAIWATASGSPAPVSAPLVACSVVLLVQLPLEWAGAQGQLRRQARLLGRYVAPAVLDELQRSGNVDVLTPRRAQITVLIADMQDYTSNTANAGLSEAARLTKGFLQALTEPVLAARGTLDRYTGDGLVAFWGAPVAQAEHSDLAVDAALAIVEQVEGFNRTRAAQGLNPVKVRIGLASGEALVGDLGTRFRIAYTAVGDCINLASRLQQASREVDVAILAADNVRLASQRHTFTPLGTLGVRGLASQAVATPIRRAFPPGAEADQGGG